MADFAFAAQAVSFRIPVATWIGVSGERPSGASISAHLTATADLLKLTGWEPTFERDLSAAMRAARANGVGDEDTQVVGRDLMEQILQVHLKAPFAQIDAWAEKPGRDLADVLDLITQAAELAAAYGPVKAGA
ncbi:hypothetical protein [Streptomyces sp. M41(2017)]|uniref:DUF6197 family protein n=1 Tax=Streptomyces sp. M41(2017) TaxID=1955065 RepID=UPI00117F73A1|nr:hypothetical protein [Streptomyces sp. M41(2017)]